MLSSYRADVQRALQHAFKIASREQPSPAGQSPLVASVGRRTKFRDWLIGSNETKGAVEKAAGSAKRRLANSKTNWATPSRSNGENATAWRSLPLASHLRATAGSP